MVTTLVSLLTDKPVRPLTAMTGEITLSGNVLPIGGIKEKTLAAKRAGVTDIILPEDNRQNVQEDLTPEQLQGLTMHYVKSIPESAGDCLAHLARGGAARCRNPRAGADRRARRVSSNRVSLECHPERSESRRAGTHVVEGPAVFAWSHSFSF